MAIFAFAVSGKYPCVLWIRIYHYFQIGNEATKIAGNTLLRETREGLGVPLNTQTYVHSVNGSGGLCTRLSKFLIGGMFKSSAYDTQCFILLLTLKLLVFECIWLRTWKGFSTLRFHSLLFLQLIRVWVAWTFLFRKVWHFMAYFGGPSQNWQSPTVARMYSHHPVMYSQDQFCSSNHAECVFFSQSLVPRCNTKAYFLQHNTGCY